MSPQEWSAFQTLKGLFSSGDFESGESGDNLKIIKDNLRQHDKHRLLQVHLKNFVTLCEQNFTDKSVPFVQSQVSASVFEQPPEIKPPTFQPPITQPSVTPLLITPLPSFQPPVNQEVKAPEPEKPKETPIVDSIILEPATPVPPSSPLPPIIDTDPDIQGEKGDNKKAKKGNGQLILIIAVIALLIGAWQIYQHWDTMRNWEPIRKWFGDKPAQVTPATPNPLVTVGAWNGIINDKPATFQFLSIDSVDGKCNVNAQICFPDNKRDTLKLSGTIDKYSIDLKDDSMRYSGVLKPDTSVYSGTVYNKNTGTSANFSFRNPKMPVDTLSENITQSDTTIVAEPAKDSVAIATVTHESGKTAGENTPEKTVTQTAIPDNSGKQPHIQTSASTTARLNGLLNRITNSDDKARDEIKTLLGNDLRVEGAANVSNVQQLITDVSNGAHYRITKVNTDAGGKVVSISVSK